MLIWIQQAWGGAGECAFQTDFQIRLLVSSLQTTLGAVKLYSRSQKTFCKGTDNRMPSFVGNRPLFNYLILPLQQEIRQTTGN